MDLTEGIVALFAVVTSMILFVGSLMLIRGVVNRYLVHDPIERWKERAWVYYEDAMPLLSFL